MSIGEYGTQRFINLKIYKRCMACRTHRPDVYIFLGCISFNIVPINTKLKNVADFNVFFLTVWVSYCLSHNKPTCTSPSRFETRQCKGSSGTFPCGIRNPRPWILEYSSRDPTNDGNFSKAVVPTVGNFS